MAFVAYSKSQNLNLYVRMLSEIYGPTQNYAKSKFEVLSHLSEVCGIASKFIAKKYDPVSANRFIPKIFGWACALLVSVKPSDHDLEQFILRKFPRCCPYCLKAKCECWNSVKPVMNNATVDSLYYQNATAQRRGANDFELMFTSIYGHSWGLGDASTEIKASINTAYLRMIEELAELSEAVRFHHLYPKNFENEIADFIARWYSLAVLLRQEQGNGALAIDELLWRAYPAQCKDCQSAPCFCPQGPVREIMSKPAPGQIQETDALTGLRNQGAYNADLQSIFGGALSVPLPYACVRIDVDSFKVVNDTYGHDAGDLALQHIAGTIRSKVRPRDRLYRVSGDEFAIIIPDSSEEEAFGTLRRIIRSLSENTVKWVSSDMKSYEFHVSVSAGVSECSTNSEIKSAFQSADKAAYASKAAGKARVSKASDMPMDPAA